MAKTNNIFSLDRFFKDPRLVLCLNRNCRFSARNEANCSFKEIEIDGDGKCRLFEPFVPGANKPYSEAPESLGGAKI